LSFSGNLKALHLWIIDVEPNVSLRSERDESGKVGYDAAIITMDRIRIAVLILLGIFVVFTSFLIYVFLESFVKTFTYPGSIRDPALRGVLGCMLASVPIIYRIIKLAQSQRYDFPPNGTAFFMIGLPLIIWQINIGQFIPLFLFSLALMILLVYKRFIRFTLLSGLLILMLASPLLFALQITLTWHYLLVLGLMLFVSYAYNHLFLENEQLTGTAHQAKVAAAEFANANVKLQNSVFFAEESIRTRERKAIAHEIHDVVGHSLMAVLVQLRNVHKMARAKPEELDESLKELIQIVDNTLQEVRRKVYVLEATDELSLSWPIKWRKMCLIFSECTGLRIQLRIPEVLVSIDNTLGAGIFRILQESLTNAIKHGNATYVDITFLKDDSSDSLMLRISDNGKGTNVDIVKGVGLKGMSQRVAELQGVIAFETLPGLGFDIGIKFPWRNSSL
jgi:signal transduction histidine kinase